eukprot:gene6329-biopygen11383
MIKEYKRGGGGLAPGLRPRDAVGGVRVEEHLAHAPVRAVAVPKLEAGIRVARGDHIRPNLKEKTPASDVQTFPSWPTLGKELGGTGRVWRGEPGKDWTTPKEDGEEAWAPAWGEPGAGNGVKPAAGQGPAWTKLEAAASGRPASLPGLAGVTVVEPRLPRLRLPEQRGAVLPRLPHGDRHPLKRGCALTEPPRTSFKQGCTAGLHSRVAPTACQLTQPATDCRIPPPHASFSCGEPYRTVCWENQMAAYGGGAANGGDAVNSRRQRGECAFAARNDDRSHTSPILR